MFFSPKKEHLMVVLGVFKMQTNYYSFMNAIFNFIASDLHGISSILNHFKYLYVNVFDS